MSSWRKRLGVEPSLPDKREATDFEDREGHRAPFASVGIAVVQVGEESRAPAPTWCAGPGVPDAAQFSINLTSPALGPFAESST